VHELLETLRNGGIAQVPEPRGLDSQGREVLSFLPGTVAHYPLPGWIWASHLLEEASALLRRIHDASAPLARGRTGWQLPSHEPIEVVCHNDVAPYNMVFEDGHLTGLIDFDTASPGPRVWDLAYLAYRLVPLGGHAGRDAPAESERMLRLDRLMSAYGMTLDRSTFLSVVVDRLKELAEYTDSRATDTGNDSFVEHAAMYRRDGLTIRAMTGQ
jgi:aminoglycoside phosphotransferase (APT) family kinase protein